MELAKKDKEMALFYPHNLYEEIGEYLDEIDLNKRYDELIKNNKIKKKYIKARELLQIIALTQFESGYPYLVYIDNVNTQNPLKELGKIKMSNLCTEIFQIQKTSIINDYGTDDKIGYDVSCNLGSINIVNIMENNEFEKTINMAMEALTAVSDKSSIANAPSIKKANEKYHSVGLGVMNLHGFLSKNKISYESDIALEFVKILEYLGIKHLK